MADYVTRQRSKAEWTAKNPILRDGEYGLERDTGKVKLGNGTHRWNSLSYTNTPPPVFDPSFEGGGVTSVAGKQGAVSLVAGDIPAGTFGDNQIPASVARDSEVDSAFAKVGAVIVIHGATTATPRPATTLPVVWFGATSPTNLADGDVFVSTQSVT